MSSTLSYFLLQILNALSFSALLMLAGLGLSLVLSLMNFINLTHGSFFLLGGYISVQWLASGAPWWLAFPAAFALCGLMGLLLDRFPFRQFYQRTHLMQVLLTYGLSVILADLMRWGFARGRTVILCTVPHKEWRLAKFGPRRGTRRPARADGHRHRFVRARDHARAEQLAGRHANVAERRVAPADPDAGRSPDELASEVLDRLEGGARHRHRRDYSVTVFGDPVTDAVEEFFRFYGSPRFVGNSAKRNSCLPYILSIQF